MLVDVFATQPQYLDHLANLVDELSARGELGRVVVHTPELLHHARSVCVGDVEVAVASPRLGDRPVLVASGYDARQCGDRPVAHLNHGVGQTYNGDPSHPVDSHGYVGGPDLDGVDLFLCVNEREAATWSERYPDTWAVAVGSPRLDGWHGFDTSWQLQRSHGIASQATVAVSWHWPCGVIAEAGSAWPEWRAQVAAWALATDHHVIGHWHPRWGTELADWYARQGIEAVGSFDQVLSRADVYVCDNSSTMYEFAATGRPVVALDSLRWRRDVEHGLRFWSHVPGESAMPGASLDWMVDRALRGAGQTERAAAVEHVWGDLLDGRATARAVDAIERQF